MANVLLDFLRQLAIGAAADEARATPQGQSIQQEYVKPVITSLLDAIVPPAAASDASAIPQAQALPNVPVGNPVLPDDKLIPADAVMTPEQEQMVMNRIATEAPDRPRQVGRNYLPDIIMQEPTQANLEQLSRQNELDALIRKENQNDFIRSFGPKIATRAQKLMAEAPEGSDPKGATALASTEALAAASDNQEPGFFDSAGKFFKDLFGDEERMTRLALAFNSMRFQPDQGLATVLGKRLETLGSLRKANRTAQALRAKGTPAAIAAADYIQQTGDAKGGMKMAMEADQYVTGSGKELMEKYGITGLVPNQPYRYNTITKKVEGVGGGATNVFAVKPDKGYMLVTDETTGGVKQVPIPGGKAAEAAGLREESKEVMTDIITDAANSIRNAMSGGLFPETGTIGSLMSYLGESDAAEVRRQVGVLTSQAQVETLNAMRQQSPTGGALGSVTERELSMLSSKAGAIDPRADAKTFLAAVDDYQRTLYRIVHGKQAGDEIYEREMAKYRQSSQQPTKQAITPEQAAAELARRRGQ